MATDRFAKLFTRNLPRAVALAKEMFAKHNKPWNDHMVASALVHQIDSLQADSLVDAWNKMTLGTQRVHAQRALDNYMTANGIEKV